VTTAKLADLSVTMAKLADASVSTSKLQDSSVTNAKIANDAVNSAKIQDGTVTGADIQDGGVGTADIANLAVTNAKLGDFSVTNAKLADGSVSTSKLQDLAVTNAKINDVAWGKITGRPAGLDDGDQVGITVETDPTVPWWVKDGTDWSEITNKPAGFSDNVDNTGSATCTWSGCMASAQGLSCGWFASCTAWGAAVTICCSGGVVTSMSTTSICTSCESSGTISTPYLFVNSDNKYLIENDVMNTFFQDRGLSIAEVESAYKAQRYGDQYAENEIYKLNLKPTVADGKILLQIRELEPEESNIDRVELIKVIHDKGTLAFSSDSNDRLIGSIHASYYNEIEVLSCEDDKGMDCLDIISKEDGNYIEKGNGGYLVLTFKPGDDDVYLYANAWQNKYIPKLINSPLQDGYSDATRCFILNAKTEDGWKQLGRKFRAHSLRSSNYRKIETDGLVDKNGIFTMKIVWDEEHKVDKIGFISMRPAAFKTEPLALASAVHSRYGDVKDKLLLKDFDYAHTVRGDYIDLTFDAGNLQPNENEEVDYFFVTQGFYHGLRTYLYPHVDTTNSYIKEIDGYVDELNAYLREKGMKEVPHID